MRSIRMEHAERNPNTETGRNASIHVEAERARSGSTPHIVRYVLLISLALAIVVLSAVWITGALSTPDQAPAGTSPASSSVQPEAGQ